MFSMIVAMDLDRGIGKENKLLWHIPEDLQYFKSITSHKIVIMGRKTRGKTVAPLSAISLDKSPVPHPKSKILSFFCELSKSITPFPSSEKKSSLLSYKSGFQVLIELIIFIPLVKLKSFSHKDVYK
jgi:hypothetical protein